MRSAAKKRRVKTRRLVFACAPKTCASEKTLRLKLRFDSKRVKLDLEFALQAAKSYIRFQHSFFGNRLTVPRS